MQEPVERAGGRPAIIARKGFSGLQIIPGTFETSSAEASYYTLARSPQQVGSGESISSCNRNDGFVAFKDGQMVMLRIPYPLGFLPRASTDEWTIRRRLERPRAVVADPHPG